MSHNATTIQLHPGNERAKLFSHVSHRLEKVWSNFIDLISCPTGVLTTDESKCMWMLHTVYKFGNDSDNNLGNIWTCFTRVIQKKWSRMVLFNFDSYPCFVALNQDYCHPNKVLIFCRFVCICDIWHICFCLHL